MYCDNIINLGCVNSCEQNLILIDNFEGFIPTRLKVDTEFNGQIISYYQTVVDFEGAVKLDITNLNEDYGYLAKIEIQNTNTGSILTQCFSFTIKPCTHLWD